MKHLLLAGLVSACTLAAQPAPGTGSIEGHVFNSLTNAPVRKATVELTALSIWLAADTDPEGRFQFTGLPPGSFRLSAKRAGFLDYPVRRPISLGPDGHVTLADIRLRPQSAIAGHVLDEDGDPVGGTWVLIFKQVYRDGRKQWEQFTANAATNENGEYRFANLGPGRYLLESYSQKPAAHNRYADPNRPDHPRMEYVETYYPNAPSEQAALPVEVGAGAEVRGIDIHILKLARPPTFHVRGKVTGMQGDPRVSVSIALIAVGGAGRGGSGHATPPDYAFDLSVPPGRYSIFANVYSGVPEVYATGSVTVTADVNGVALAMSPPPEVSARISLAESGRQVSLQRVRVALRGIGFRFGDQDAVSDATGKLVFGKAIPPGRYSLNVDSRSIPDGCFVQNVKLGGQEVSVDDFEILASSQIEIVLSNTAGKIAGSVSDADGKPFPNSTVTLIPQDGNSRPAKQSVDDDGNFKFASLRPGKYTLFAWEEVDDDLWQDPEFNKKYEKRATEITVGPGETQNAQLRIIAAEEMK